MKRWTIPMASILLAASFGCTPSPKSARGFRLPDGDVEKGKVAFLDMKCNNCHSVAGVEVPAPEGRRPFVLELGGKDTRVHTYGELVTSIINPSHTLSPRMPREMAGPEGASPMPDYTEVMTVRQMIDLVAFLQSRYQLVIPPPSRVG